MGPTWGPSGADRTQAGSMSAPWTFSSGLRFYRLMLNASYHAMVKLSRVVICRYWTITMNSYTVFWTKKSWMKYLKHNNVKLLAFMKYRAKYINLFLQSTGANDLKMSVNCSSRYMFFTICIQKLHRWFLVKLKWAKIYTKVWCFILLWCDISLFY